MRLIVDTNVLIAALIKNSLTREILLRSDFDFLIPEFAMEEIERHRLKIARQACLKTIELDILLTLLTESVTIVPMIRIIPY